MTVTIQELKKIINQELLESSIIDVREKSEYCNEHIPSSSNYPLSTLEQDLDKLDKNIHYYICCQSGNRSRTAVSLMKKNGFDKVTNIEGGLSLWKQDGNPTIRGRVGLPIMQQVFVIAGVLIITFILLSFVVKWFIGIPFLVGCGLIYAGVSGNCMMSKILIKMPWNRA